MSHPPIDPPDGLAPYAPAATRTVPLLGGTAELALVPSRRHRTGHVRDARPAFTRGPAARILREEACWRDDGVVMTPNRFPFARGQRILWMDAPAREPDLRFWRAALAWVAASDGTVLLNNIGAASTISRAHAHLIAERLPFVTALAERPLATDLIDAPDGCELVRKEAPFCMIGVRGGDAASRARALLQLADERLTPTWNVIGLREEVWVVPRSVETPRPHFPDPVGAAEYWGRWCYVDEGPFEAAIGDDLERALVMAGKPAID